MNAAELTTALGGKWSGTRGTARCPVTEGHSHGDKAPSFSIQEKEGRVLVHCHTGCAQDVVLNRLIELGYWTTDAAPRLIVKNGTTGESSNGHSEAPPPPPATDGPTRIVAQYPYTDESGKLLYQAIRQEPKTFRQRRPTLDGGWIYNLEGTRRVLYRLPELLKADTARTVFVVEGEKDVDRLRSIGFVATTNAMGAGKWLPDYNVWLKGRPVVILPDNDDPGRRHAEAVATHLLPVAASVKVIQLEGLPEKGDVSDWLEKGGTRPTLEDLVAAAQPLPKPEPAYPIHRLADLMLKPHESGGQVVEGILWKHWTHWLFSRPNTGKTVFLLAMGLSVAAGKPFLGRKVEQTPVLFFSEDSPESIIQDYTDRICELLEIDFKDLDFFINRGRGLRIVDDKGVKMALDAFDSCPKLPGLILWDACERLVPSDKFTTKELDPFAKCLAQVVDRGGTNVVIDHVRKETKDNANADLMEKLYGAGAKSQVCDAALYLGGSFREGTVQAQWAKFRGQFPAPFDLSFHYDTGFSLKDRMPSDFSPSEKKVTQWFANAPHRPYTLEEVRDGAKISDRTIDRVLPRLVQIRWLTTDESKRPYTYSLNPAAPGAFA